MNKWLIAALVLCAVFFTGSYFYSKKKEGEVLSESTLVEPIPTLEPTATPTLMPTLTPTQIPTPTAIPTPILTPTPASVPQPTYSSEQIHGFIERFAGQYGVDPNVLRHIATCESGFRADAVNGPYVGLYQFSVTTWANNRMPMGEDADSDLRANAEEAVQTAAFMVANGRGDIWPNCMP